MSANPNPYAAPFSVDRPVQRRPGYGSMGLAFVAAVAVVAYVGFTIVLLGSSPPDQKGGIMFLFNIPFLIGLVSAATRSTRMAACFGVLAVITQVLLTLIMLSMESFDPGPVLVINSCVIVPLFVLKLWAWSHHCSMSEKEQSSATRKAE